MAHPFEAREVSAWIAGPRAERAARVLRDPRLRLTRIGSDDAKTRRTLARDFNAQPFDDLRQLAVATPSVLWIDRRDALDERERGVLANEDIAIVAGACTLPFLLALPHCETAPSFRRMQVGRALQSVIESFGRVEVFQTTVSVADESRLSEGLRVAAASALAVLGPIDQVTALGARVGTLAASVIGERGFGTLAVGVGVEAASFALVGEGGLATIASGLVGWRRADGSWMEETRLESDGDEPTIQTLLEAERPTARGHATRAQDLTRQHTRVRIAALADTVRLCARTGQSESVEAMLRRFGVDESSGLLERDALGARDSLIEQKP